MTRLIAVAGLHSFPRWYAFKLSWPRPIKMAPDKHPITAANCEFTSSCLAL